MTIDGAAMLSFAVPATMAMLSAAAVLAFVRLVRGPNLPDRVVALDLFTAIVVGVIAVYTIDSQSSEMLRAAIVLALISFLGTVAFARYLEKRGMR